MLNIEYKVPVESESYPIWSEYVVLQVSTIIGRAIEQKTNLIFIHTNLRRGLPLENINKVAGPFIEAWALEQFELLAEQIGNKFNLINVEAGKRLDPFDIVLQFKHNSGNDNYVSANVDVKATSQDIATSGKSPNITSYRRIRTEYVNDPDYIFIVLSLKHKVYGERDAATGLTNGVMEVTAHNVYDLKYISAKDLSYNSALGNGQLQIRDIHYVGVEKRTTWELLQLLDNKFIRSCGEAEWLELARKHKWIKE